MRKDTAGHHPISRWAVVSFIFFILTTGAEARSLRQSFWPRAAGTFLSIGIVGSVYNSVGLQPVVSLTPTAAHAYQPPRGTTLIQLTNFDGQALRKSGLKPVNETPATPAIASAPSQPTQRPRRLSFRNKDARAARAKLSTFMRRLYDFRLLRAERKRESIESAYGGHLREINRAQVGSDGILVRHEETSADRHLGDQLVTSLNVSQAKVDSLQKSGAKMPSFGLRLRLWWRHLLRSPSPNDPPIYPDDGMGHRLTF